MEQKQTTMNNNQNTSKLFLVELYTRRGFEKRTLNAVSIEDLLLNLSKEQKKQILSIKDIQTGDLTLYV